MSSVSPIRPGVYYDDTREPVQGVIKELESLLEMARSGEMVSFVTAYRFRDDTTAYTWGGSLGRDVVGALEVAKADIVTQLLAQK